MTTMRSDAEFIADMERAARALRAAVAGAAINGLSPADIDRIVRDGVAEADQWQATRDYRARARAIGYWPTGLPLPEPVWTQEEPPAPDPDAPQPGDFNWRPRPIHPAVGHGRHAA